MRRAAFTAFHTARRSTLQALKSRRPLTRSQDVLRPYFSTHARRYSAQGTRPLLMRGIPRTPLAIVGALGAFTAYVSYRGPARAFNSTAVQAEAPIDPAITTIQPVPTRERRALVVDNEQFYTGQIVGDGPLAKDTDDYGRKVLEMMSPADATARLRRTEESYLVGRGRGVVRYDVVQLPSNDPIEDDHAEKIVEVPNTVAATDAGVNSSDWMFWGVYDGHSGWTTSAKLRQVLISFAARELNATYKAALSNTTSPFPTSESIDAALKSAFVKLDNEICHNSVDKLFKTPSKRLAAELLAPALSGSCALLSFYDSRSNIFRVACTGDSRAVLGRKSETSNKWHAIPLSEDQTGSNPNEEARMRAEHPGEPYVIAHGRVLGNLEPTRAFGDAIYKWSKPIQDKLSSQFFGRTPNQRLLTPPYVTAEPVVTTTKIQPGKGDFVVLATDGLWEMLTNEEVVGLVGQWVEAQSPNSNSSAKGGVGTWLSTWFGGTTNATTLPVEKGGNMDRSGRVLAGDASDAEKQTAVGGKNRGNEANLPIRQQQYGIKDAHTHERFVVQDKNAATHLVRNALGGKDSDMVCALLTLQSPYSRRYRDDLTVEVIFFGEDSRSDGVVRVNEDATAPKHEGPELRSKL